MSQGIRRDKFLLELARRRKSIRRFKAGVEIPLARVLEAIEVALEAPSGMNCQPWQFIVVSDRELKHRIRIACEEAEKKLHGNVRGEFKKWLEQRNITWEKPFLEDATYLIIVYADKHCPYTIQSTWLAIGYLLLALEENGLASLTYTPPDAEKVNSLLKVPKRYKLETIIPVGYPLEEKIKEPREPLINKVYLNKWGKRIDLKTMNT